MTALPEPDEGWAMEAITAAIRLGLIGRAGDPSEGVLAPTQLGLMVAAVLEQLTAPMVEALFDRGHLRREAMTDDELPLAGRSGVIAARYFDDPRRGGTELLAPTPEDTP